MEGQTFGRLYRYYYDRPSVCGILVLPDPPGKQEEKAAAADEKRASGR